jgi:hypothetical protein
MTSGAFILTNAVFVAANGAFIAANAIFVVANKDIAVTLALRHAPFTAFILANASTIAPIQTYKGTRPSICGEISDAKLLRAK